MTTRTYTDFSGQMGLDMCLVVPDPLQAGGEDADAHVTEGPLFLPGHAGHAGAAVLLPARNSKHVCVCSGFWQRSWH